MTFAYIKAFFAVFAGLDHPEPPGQGGSEALHAGVAQGLLDSRQRRLQRAQRRGAHHRHQPSPPGWYVGVGHTTVVARQMNVFKYKVSDKQFKAIVLVYR